jgi:hypothetical protein
MSRELSAADVAAWRRQGWLVVDRAFAPAEVTALRRWVDEIALPPMPGEQRLHYFEETANGPAICRTERFLADHQGLHRLLQFGTLPELAAALTGEAMLLYKEKVNHKQPGGAGFAAHQDATAYPYVSYNVTALIPVDPMTLENGCLEFATLEEAHLLPADDRGCIAATALAGLTFAPVALEPGGALFFTSYAPHRSGPNRSADQRRALYLTYNRARDGDLRASYYAERDRRLAAQADNPEVISMIRHFQGTATRAAGE